MIIMIMITIYLNHVILMLLVIIIMLLDFRRAVHANPTFRDQKMALH